MSHKLGFGTLLSVVLLQAFFPCASRAQIITFDTGYKLLGSYSIQGLLAWDDTWTYNGQPTSPTNYPSDYELELSALVSLFTPVDQSNIVYVDVNNVVTTNFGSAYGAAFADLTLTGISLQGGFPLNGPFTYSGNYALPGESLMGTPSGVCADSQDTSLNNTPGWMATSAGGGVLLQTANGVTDGLTKSWGCIYGDFRIIGGAVFALQFSDNTNLKRLDPDNLNISAIYGLGRQTIPGVLLEPSIVPEPSSAILLATVILLGGSIFLKARPANPKAIP